MIISYLKPYNYKQNTIIKSPVGWVCRIHWLRLYRGVRHPNECPGYDTKQSDCEAPVTLELWGMPSLTDPLWPGVVAPDRVLSMSQIELFDI